MNENDLGRARATAAEARAVAGQKAARAQEAKAHAVAKRLAADRGHRGEPLDERGASAEMVARRRWPKLAEAMDSFELVGAPWPENGPRVRVHACMTGGQAWPLIAFDSMAIVDLSQPDHPQLSELRERMDAGGGTTTTIPQSEGVAEIQLWRVPGLSLAEVVAMAEQPNNAVYPNLMYFPRSGSFVFHPDTKPTELAGPGPLPQQLSVPASGPKRVLTVDTGSVEGSFQSVSVGGNDPYPYSEAVHGHGPAISDLIGRLLSTDGDTSRLLGIDHSAGAMKQPMFNQALNVRGFDLAALMGTLARVDDLDPDVLNFSFGTLQCPNMAGEADPLFRWLKHRGNMMVAAAAGNHGEVPDMADVPSWPAAYARQGNPDIELDNVVSVGSRVEHGGKAMSTFSGKGATVVAYAQGENVNVSRPGSGQKNGSYASWQGTSFATPQVAADLACGLTKQNVIDKYRI